MVFLEPGSSFGTAASAIWSMAPIFLATGRNSISTQNLSDKTLRSLVLIRSGCMRVLNLEKRGHKNKRRVFLANNFPNFCMEAPHKASPLLVGRQRHWSVNVRFDVAHSAGSAGCQIKCPANKRNSGKITHTQLGTGPLGVRGCPARPPTLHRRHERVATAPPARQEPAWPLTLDTWNIQRLECERANGGASMCTQLGSDWNISWIIIETAAPTCWFQF